MAVAPAVGEDVSSTPSLLSYEARYSRPEPVPLAGGGAGSVGLLDVVSRQHGAGVPHTEQLCRIHTVMALEVAIGLVKPGWTMPAVVSVTGDDVNQPAAHQFSGE